MNILMMTNTYVPHVGGVARSVVTFTNELRNLGHRVIVVAPEYEEDIEDERDTIRIPAIQHFNGSDFSMVLQIPAYLDAHLHNFRPNVVHSHHPFLVGSTAARISTKYNVPLVYTQHTMYEEYTHYVPVGLHKMKKFVIGLSTGYANMSEHVIAPSASIAKVLVRRGVKIPIDIIPTGVYTDKFEHGNGRSVRLSHNIPEDAFVIGHVGRLAPEKNLEFLSKAVASFLRNVPEVHFMVVGYGSSEEHMKDFFAQEQLQEQVHFLGKLEGQDLVDAYCAMDIFAFSSKSETQGLVLVEAMSAGVPVVALDAPGVREVMKDGINGYLLKQENYESFSRALNKLHRLSKGARQEFIIEAKKTAQDFSVQKCVSKLISLYNKLPAKKRILDNADASLWHQSIERIKTEWELFHNFTAAIEDALQKK
jgi:1,2-diacylglycerol 3-alpha-glucosyltransferase